MSQLPAPPRLLRALLRLVLPRDVREDVDGDLHELYLAQHADRGAAVAMMWYGAEACSFAARALLDRVSRSSSRMRRVTAALAIPSMLDVRLGARMLARAPGLTLVGGFGMAVAVALGVSAYDLVNARFFPDLPLPGGDRMVALGRFDAQGGEEEKLLHDYLVWQRELRSVSELGAFRTIGRNLIPEAGPAEPIILAEMTASGFLVARVPPLLGRTLLPADELPAAAPVVVIGHDVWKARFAGDASILGRRLRIGRAVHTVVGVMPPGFSFPVNHGWWVPLRLDPAAAPAADSGPELDVFGRLAPGVTMAAAQAELSALGGGRAAEPRIAPYTDVVLDAGSAGVTGPEAVVRRLIELLLVVVAVNVAVLVYARTVARSEEIIVRTALGATRGRIVAQLFVEALVLSGLATLAGLAMASAGIGMLHRGIVDAFDGTAPFWMQPGLSTGAVLYALVLALIGAVIVGIWPALRATGVQLRAAMGSLGSGSRARLGRTWTALIVFQVAFTVAILPMALLKVAETVAMATRPAGFPADEYLSAVFTIDTDGASAMAALMTRLRAEPAVRGATVTRQPPWAGIGNDIEVEGGVPQRVRVGVVDTSYFGLLGVRAVTGRTFNTADAALPMGARPVVVNRSFVRELVGAGNPIGRRVRHHGPTGETGDWLTIAGVIDDFPARIRTPGEESTRMMYELQMPDEAAAGLLSIRLQGLPPAMFVSSLQRIATSVDPTLQLRSARPLAAMYDDYRRLAARLATLLALVAGSVLLLAATSTHALVSFTVNERRREIGIRTALGAPPHHILQKVLGQAARQLTLGATLGLAMAVLLDVWSGGVVMNGRALLLVPATALFMLAVGLLAAAGPVRRGLRVHAAEMLQAG